MSHYCLARLNIRRAIISICPLLAIMVPASPSIAQQTLSLASATAASLAGKQAPAFRVMTLEGKEVSLADYKGKALIVNFWATWCAACKLEMPWLAQLREHYAPQGLEVIGIVTDGATEEKVRQIADKYGVKYLISRCNHKTAQAYGGLPYLPESFYIDKHGKVVLAAADASSKEEIERNIRKLLRLAAR